MTHGRNRIGDNWRILESAEEVPLQSLAYDGDEFSLVAVPQKTYRETNSSSSSNLSSSSTSPDYDYNVKPRLRLRARSSSPTSERDKLSVLRYSYTYVVRLILQVPWGLRRLKLVGWRMGVFGSALCVAVVLLINLVATIWAVAVYPVHAGLGTIYEGSCDKTKSMSLWIHLAINVLSSQVLACSNYTQQCLIAPTRTEVDTAHEHGGWVDIGVPSVRNLSRISTRRWILWWAICLMSVPMHLLYNSAVYSTIVANEYAVAVVQENAFEPNAPPLWPNGTQFDYSNLVIYEQYNNMLNALSWETIHNIFHNTVDWEWLSPAGCLSKYNKNLLSERQSLVLITYGSPNTSVSTHIAFLGSVQTFGGEPQRWMCDIHRGAIAHQNTQCNVVELLEEVRAGGNWTIDASNLPYNNGSSGVVKKCLSQPKHETCKLQFSITILIIVMVGGVVKVVCMVVTLLDTGFKPLVTIGDAIQCFLIKPDPFTAGVCYTSRAFIERAYRTGTPWNTGALRPWRWRTIHYRWLRAVSATRWITSLFMCLSVICVCSVLLVFGLRTEGESTSINLASIWSRGVGRLNLASIVFLFGQNLNIHSATTIANLPQAILSALYLVYNALFTCMLMAHEYATFALHRKSLRVSMPHGHQRSTYWLHIPYRFAVPLIVLSTLLHWLTSQSLFLVRIKVSTPLIYPDRNINTVGYSSMAIIFTLVLGSLTLAVAAVIGLQRYKADMPLAGSCSAAISAHCHPLPGMSAEERREMVERKLKWGDVSGAERVGHLAFTDEDVIKPVRWVKYAGFLSKKGRSEKEIGRGTNGGADLGDTGLRLRKGEVEERGRVKEL